MDSIIKENHELTNNLLEKIALTQQLQSTINVLENKLDLNDKEYSKMKLEKECKEKIIDDYLETLRTQSPQVYDEIMRNSEGSDSQGIKIDMDRVSDMVKQVLEQEGITKPTSHEQMNESQLLKCGDGELIGEAYKYFQNGKFQTHLMPQSLKDKLASQGLLSGGSKNTELDQL